jgi:leucyl-tRNA synthetase
MNLQDIGKKRQKIRKDSDLYKVQENNKPKYYILDMFPYPSGAGLHVGHPKGFVASDCLARKKMLQGFNVLHPMGFDTFGLGTEQYAIDNKMKPQDVSDKNIATYIKQLEQLGLTYDRSRSFSTAQPDYYKWTQTIFLKFYTHYYDETAKKAKPLSELEAKLKAEGKNQEEINKILDSERLAYVDYKPINRCPSCKTGLANEDLDDGKCERCGSEVEQKPMRQWVLRITKYADRLISGLDKLSRDESMKDLERNWIGKSEGTQFKMEIENSKDFFEVYTTRVDTVFGMSFVVMAPEHPLVDSITTPDHRASVEAYKEQAKFKTQLERTELQKEKTGVFTGTYAINPFNGDKIPVYIGDYVLANYGTGVVMAVPAHDERDYEFAQKYNIPIIQSIAPADQNHPDFDAIAKCELCYPDK